jgi:5-formyltetrahydrofolate cyclo-ligase
LVTADKKALRRALLAQRQLLSDDSVRSASFQLCTRLQTWLASQAVTQLALYRAFRKEPSLDPLEALWPPQHRFYPRIDASRGMEFRSVSYDTSFQRHSMGMEEPPADGPLLQPDKHTAIVVPGIAFDKRGYRLGYGGGYYDAFLPHFPGKVIGVCLNSFVFDMLPQEPHDAPVQVVITESAIY